ncbi:MAG TPA: AMP-binding protein [Hyphomicrobiaceae bacterium]|nr:AMP-binding protein [Hyphomicrobiaceae bacterium]
MSATSSAAATASKPAVFDTVPKLLLRNAERFGSRPAYRHKDFGIWQTWTWAQALEEIRAFSLGLKALGLGAGEKVAIIGNNRPRLYWAFAAIQSLGAIPVPMYQDGVAEEMAYVLDHADISFAVVEDQEQVDKLVTVGPRLPKLHKVIYDEPRGLTKYPHENMHAYEDVQRMGRDELKRNPKADADWRAGIAAGKGSDISVILYTSGTTGKSKGVMLSHDNVVISGNNANAFDRFTADDTMIAYLPMAWVGDHIFSYGQAYSGALCVACPESPETAQEDRRELGPTYFFAPPRVFENMLTQIVVRMEDAGAIKRRMFHYFLEHAKKVGPAILDGRSVGFLDKLKYRFGDLLVYGPLRNRMGFSKLRVAYTAGEAIGPELFSFFRALGINLKQLYGQTEASVFVTLQPNGEVFPETVGKPGPGIEIKVDDAGEVLFKSPGVFVEYYKNEEATKSTKTPDGWVKTGDAGFIDQRGHLQIIDRAKDVGRLNNGALFAPKYIENRLKFYPEIKEAVAFGHGRDYCACFINIDLVSVGNWAERNNIVYSSYQELSQLPAVYEMIEKRVDELNRVLAGEPRMFDSQIRRFLILHKELDADDGELTRTLKVRRGFIAERYGPFIKALYDGSKTASISTEVTFEDGRTGRIEGDVRIIDMKAHPAPKSAATPIKEAAE